MEEGGEGRGWSLKKSMQGSALLVKPLERESTFGARLRWSFGVWR